MHTSKTNIKSWNTKSPTKTSQKTWQRGAGNQQATAQAPQRKTNPTKGKPQTNKAITQEAYPQTTQVKQTKENPKTKDEPSKTTAVQGQKTKTNLHRPRKTNQIRINAMFLAGEKPPWKQQRKKLISQFGFAADSTLST